MRYRLNGNYIEIYFDAKPNDRIIETLKICGWRWYSKNRCWSNYYSYENLEFAKSLEKDFLPKQESKLMTQKRVTLNMVDVIVRSNTLYCNQHHDKEEYAGEIEVVDKKNNVRTYLVPIMYCQTCGVYYLLEETYKDLVTKGRIRAKILSYKVYKKQGKADFDGLNEYSPLREYGYNVSEKTGYSDLQRQSILEDIIDYNILDRDMVIYYLDLFIKMNNSRAINAVNKWKMDRDYISKYRIGSAKKIKIGSITVIDYLRNV